MNRLKGLMAIVGAAAALAAIVACGGGAEASNGVAGNAATQPAQAGNAAMQPAQAGNAAMQSAQVGSAATQQAQVGNAATQPAQVGNATTQQAQVGNAATQPAAAGNAATQQARAVGAAAQQAQAGSAQAGIWVTGEGTLTVEPDLVLLNIGVDSRGETVAEANDGATTAMDAVVAALRGRDVADNDIQTSRFSIYPQYSYREETVDGVRMSREVLVGYRVRNSASVKIRDLDVVGEIIEEVVTAGGDIIRIDGINFTVEAPKLRMAELREMAVADARAKAEHLAELSGVALGDLTFISEGAGAAPYSDPYGVKLSAAFAMEAAAAPSVSGGELELTLSVNAVFSIQ